MLVSFDLARHSCFHRNFQLFPCVLKIVLELFIFRNDELNTSQLSCIVELRFSRQPTFAFLSVELLLTYPSIFLATGDRAWMLLAFSSIAHPGPCVSVWRFLIQCGELCETSMHLIGLGHHRYSNNRLCGFPANTSKVACVALVTSKISQWSSE